MEAQNYAAVTVNERNFCSRIREERTSLKENELLYKKKKIEREFHMLEI